ncbi:MAG: chemotaxis signal transduction protein CheV [Betaproteobacteria bacterium]|jgi:two-component system chemotaxis response regulator CheV|nr:chemotaxis signal transduction protein CheV [Betaproteobacteria bacterium]NBR98720.1 chemotaxis signal transduction protein CheV [Betaproteobacteria bacterium]NBT06218.1 chemotaxis signal transduction protein CheV [Betaproteobacteria bacterium]NBU12283.1 chemotaxis signal transduction protein CheV [Betaproteobacteria bacterium]NBY53636.1 chemotaxis signal transduction protein CheV [Betaproteobacteria bacterium]
MSNSVSSSSEHQSLLDAVDARTKLAGSNRMELLLFGIGTPEIFAINVFKVREVTKTPPITLTPNMPEGVEGVISLRGNIIPVLKLAHFLDRDGIADCSGSTMMVTEYSRRTQGFLVDSVDRIVRVDWESVRAPEGLMARSDGLVTAMTELPEGHLVSILDVEQILATAFGEGTIPELEPADVDATTFLFFVDDSSVARREIGAVMDKLGVRTQLATNGNEALNRLQGLATQAERDGERLGDTLRVILVDAEMPEMDGYVLTRHLKSDRRFDGIPIVMHSSLSSDANRAMGAAVGVDAYVAKFNPEILADTLRPLLSR